MVITPLWDTELNTKGRQLHRLIQNRIIRHIGPHFPTYIARTIATTPVIILTNTQTYNIHITQRLLTPSDHLPIVCTTSIKHMQIPSLPRPSFKQANLVTFNEETKQKYYDPSIPDNLALKRIDSYMDDWYNMILTSAH